MAKVYALTVVGITAVAELVKVEVVPLQIVLGVAVAVTFVG